MALNSSDVNKYVRILTRIRSHLQVLQQMEITVTLIHIPGHSNIKYNDMADTRAKEAWKKASKISSYAISSATCKTLISKQINMCWQKRWNVGSTGRATYDLCLTVGKKPFLPLDSCTAVSYVWLLLHDICLDPHHRAVSTSRVCSCGKGTDDTHHFFLECRMYEKARQVVTATVRNIWEECEQSSILKLTLPLLLTPSTICFLNSTQRRMMGGGKVRSARW